MKRQHIPIAIPCGEKAIYRFKERYKEGNREYITVRKVLMEYGLLSEKGKRICFRCLDYDFGNREAYLSPAEQRIVYLFDEVVLDIEDIAGETPEQIESVQVANFQSLSLRWEKTRQTIRSNNKGDVIEKYLRHIDALITNEDTLLDFIYSNRMYGLLLHALSSPGSGFTGSNIFFDDGMLQEAQYTDGIHKYELLCIKRSRTP